jgi:hypothetical protein
MATTLRTARPERQGIVFSGESAPTTPRRVAPGHPARHRQVGNSREAFSHLALVDAAANITAAP